MRTPHAKFLNNLYYAETRVLGLWCKLHNRRSVYVDIILHCDRQTDTVSYLLPRLTELTRGKNCILLSNTIIFPIYFIMPSLHWWCFTEMWWYLNFVARSRSFIDATRNLDIKISISSVRPSVCLPGTSGIVAKRLNTSSKFFFHCRIAHSFNFSANKIS